MTPGFATRFYLLPVLGEKEILMKRILVYLLCTLLTMAASATFIFFATLYGCFHRPITRTKTESAFLAATERELDKQFVGNFAMAVFKNGKLAFEKFHSAGKPVDRHTVFQVSSLSKWVSTVGILKLVENGTLDLDRPVSTYLTRWQLPSSPFNEQVTVRRLLSHTAGLTDGLGYSGFEIPEQVQTLEESLTHAADADDGVSGSVFVGIKPGTEFKYSGGGYTLLQLIVEEVTGMSFADYMKQSVFIPLGMMHSTYQWSNSSGLRLTEFYHSDGRKANHFLYASLAATSLYTSLSDMELFFQAHLPGADGSPIGRGIIKPETLELMRTPHAQQYGMDIWGLGTILYSTTDRGNFIVGHDGKSTPPINTAVRLDPQTGNGIIVLETGNPQLATRLASEWVFWKTGGVDLFLFPTMFKRMVVTIIVGWVTNIAAALWIAMSQRKRRVAKTGL